MEKYANMKTKCLTHKGLNHTEAGRGGGYFRGWFQLVCLVRLRYNCIHIGKAVKVGLLQFDVNIVHNVNIANVSIVKITKIAPSASIVYQFLVFFLSRTSSVQKFLAYQSQEPWCRRMWWSKSGSQITAIIMGKICQI